MSSSLQWRPRSRTRGCDRLATERWFPQLVVQRHAEGGACTPRLLRTVRGTPRQPDMESRQAGFRTFGAASERPQSQLDANDNFAQVRCSPSSKYDFQRDWLHPGHFIDVSNTQWLVPSPFGLLGTPPTILSDAGKRLCEAAEWEQACNGRTDWPYPYGKVLSFPCGGAKSAKVESIWMQFSIRCRHGGKRLEWTATPLNALLVCSGSTATWRGRGTAVLDHARHLADDGYQRPLTFQWALMLSGETLTPARQPNPD